MSDELGASAKSPVVVDPHQVNVSFSDWIVSGGAFNGIVNIDLGAVDHTMRTSNDELARIIVTTRLRFGSQFAETLYNFLGQILGKPGHGEEPPPQPIPPRGLMN
jgi:hypothetical protein